MKRERRVPLHDDWQTGFACVIEREPCRNRTTRIELAFKWPIEADTPRRMALQHIE